MQIKTALSIGFCPHIIYADTGKCVRASSSLERIAQRGSIAFKLLLKWGYSLKQPASVAATTLFAASLITFAFYPQTALLLASPLMKTALIGLRHLLYISIQSTLSCLALRAWIRLSPEKEPLYTQNILVPSWDIVD